MANGHTVEKLASQATEFVIGNKGTWGHEDWESFCAQAAVAGVELNEYNRVALGNLLEAVRYFYQLSPAPAAVAKKKPAPCKKAAVKKSSAK
jgi:hypothetical protein